MRPLLFFCTFLHAHCDAAAGIFVFCPTFESDFVVGYAQSELKSGATMVTPQFINIGAEAMPLQSIKAIGEDVLDNVEIQTLDSAGRTVDSYVWVDWVSDSECWMNADMEEATGVTFSPGQGLWVFGKNADQSIQTAGQVELKDVVVPLRAGASGIGNPFPITIDLQDIIAEGDDVLDNVEIQTLDSAGRTVDSYVWVDWVAENECWMNADMEEATGVTIAPGQGLWIFGKSSTQSIRFPAPEL